MDNYIGANTLVELATAFTWNRKIFLFNNIYPPLRDELIAWNCICLNGDLKKVKKVLMKEEIVFNKQEHLQLSLFDDYK